MANIRGPAHGHSNLTGTAGDDTILAFGNANTITGAGGNDTVSATHGSNNAIFVGSRSDGLVGLNDTIRIDGGFDTVTGGDENFRVSGYASHSRVALGRGNDTVVLHGAGDFVTIAGGHNQVRVLGGHATVAITGQSASGYTDDVTVSGSHNDVADSLSNGPYPAAGVVDIHGGSGFSSFSLGSASGVVVTQGIDNVIYAGDANSTIVAGSGHDIVEVSSGPGFLGGVSHVRLAGEYNLVTGTGGASTINGGAGHDTIDLRGDYNAHFTITEGGQHNSITLTSTVGATITPGTGNDTVSVDGGSATMTFHGYGDALYLNGAGNYGGYPVATVTDQSSGLNIFLEANDGGDIASSGDLHISDFDPHGVITFEDGRGGFTSAAQVMSDLHSSGNGQYSLVLRDGSGTITFLHTANLTAANFHV